ncbi:MAG: DUF1648 domain-containing protein [Syntrophomonadaceae bacterium]|jgi:uncharacterized membrane protein|nr:DUF1648 domain-containing protein [Syntrophomonadaceae bacterium]
MNSNRGVLFWLSYAIAVATIAWVVWVYPDLAERFPVHWNVHGLPDRFAPKSQLLWLAGLVFAIPLLMDILPRIDPRHKNYAYFGTSYQYIKLGITAFMAFVTVLSIQAGRSPEQVLSTRVMMLGLGLMFMILGNYLTKVRSNWFVGIKTPWTLSSDEVWRKTTRVGGWAFFLAGLIIALSGFFLSGKTLFYLIIGVVVAVSVGTFVYSYLLYRSLDKSS